MKTGGCWRHAGNSWISGEFPRVEWVRRPQRERERWGSKAGRLWEVPNGTQTFLY